MTQCVLISFKHTWSLQGRSWLALQLQSSIVFKFARHHEHRVQCWRSVSSEVRKVAILYQAVEPPVINGVRKPPKPGGYQDSGADIGYVLKQQNFDVVTPKQDPDPQSQESWCFPDNEAGITSALEHGATHLWANTILFASHPLQSIPLSEHQLKSTYVVGQPPRLVEQYDDKNYVNSMLRDSRTFTMPQSWITESAQDSRLPSLPYPVVGKPIRGRGSQGVKLYHSHHELQTELASTSQGIIMVEEYLSGEEATITVFPPSASTPKYWALPVVVRFNHQDGIAPYNGAVAVTSNSRAISPQESDADPTYKQVCDECVRAAEMLKVTAPIRIDVRRFNQEPGSRFALFDVNMKPNMTGPGRPGREDQASLTTIAAEQLGWSYGQLLARVLETATPLNRLREMRIE